MYACIGELVSYDRMSRAGFVILNEQAMTVNVMEDDFVRQLLEKGTKIRYLVYDAEENRIKRVNNMLGLPCFSFPESGRKRNEATIIFRAKDDRYVAIDKDFHLHVFTRDELNILEHTYIDNTDDDSLLRFSNVMLNGPEDIKIICEELIPDISENRWLGKQLGLISTPMLDSVTGDEIGGFSGEKAAAIITKSSRPIIYTFIHSNGNRTTTPYTKSTAISVALSNSGAKISFREDVIEFISGSKYHDDNPYYFSDGYGMLGDDD